jgi:hypothetical protein
LEAKKDVSGSKDAGAYIKAGCETESKEALHELANHPSAAVRRRLAENPRVSRDIMALLAKDNDAEVRSALAWNSSAPLEILEKLCEDPDVNVRLSLTENHCIHKAVLQRLTGDENPYVQYHAQRALEVVEMEEQLEQRQFSFREGSDAKLGELVVQAGLTSEEAMKIFLETAQNTGQSLGHVLIMDGGLSRVVVAEALMIQCAIRDGNTSQDEGVARLKSLL